LFPILSPRFEIESPNPEKISAVLSHEPTTKFFVPVKILLVFSTTASLAWTTVSTTVSLAWKTVSTTASLAPTTVPTAEVYTSATLSLAVPINSEALS